MDDQGAAQCSICHDDFLSQEVCALKCGHVYHSECVRAWLTTKTKSSGGCPQCKKPARANEIRVLHFQMGDVSSETLGEVLRFESASEAERERYEAEFLAEHKAAKEELLRVEGEIEEVQRSALASKKMRHEALGPEVAEKDAQLHAARKELEERTVECMQMQVELDEATSYQQRRLPIPPVREEDPDVHEERKRLRIIQASDRALQLHKSIVSSRQMLEETRKLKMDRLSEGEAMEDEVKRRRQLDSRLRRRLSEQAELDSSATEAHSVVTAASPPGDALDKVAPIDKVAAATGGVEVGVCKSQGSRGSTLISSQSSVATSSSGADLRTQTSTGFSNATVCSTGRQAAASVAVGRSKVGEAALDEDVLFGLEGRGSRGSGGILGSRGGSGSIFGRAARPVAGAMVMAAGGGGPGRRIGGAMGALFAKPI